MKEFMLVISMWGNTGAQWEYIGNQIVLEQPLSEQQCQYMSDKKMWTEHYDNEFYKVLVQCYPKSCANKDSCD